VASEPLPLSDHGYYVEVQVMETTDNIADGSLGLGVTMARPEEIGTMPDRLSDLERGILVYGGLR